MALALESHQSLIMAGLSEDFLNVIGLKAILIEADKKCDSTVYRKRLMFPNTAERMKQEGKIGFESGRP